MAQGFRHVSLLVGGALTVLALAACTPEQTGGAAANGSAAPSVSAAPESAAPQGPGPATSGPKGGVPTKGASKAPAGGAQIVYFKVIQQPKCPAGWERVQFNGFTGSISCVVKKPALTCASKTQAFYSANWPTQCQAGCEGIVY
jgi:hypothetical protein